MGRKERTGTQEEWVGVWGREGGDRDLYVPSNLLHKSPPLPHRVTSDKITRGVEPLFHPHALPGNSHTANTIGQYHQLG
jgi:hypothetical protein